MRDRDAGVVLGFVLAFALGVEVVTAIGCCHAIDPKRLVGDCACPCYEATADTDSDVIVDAGLPGVP